MNKKSNWQEFQTVLEQNRITKLYHFTDFDSLGDRYMSYSSLIPKHLSLRLSKAVIDYVQSGYRNFTYRQEGDIKRYMNGQPDKEEAAGTMYNASLPFLKVDECERVRGQLADIAQDMKEGLRQNQRRRFHM